jgi:hypothetical protein
MILMERRLITTYLIVASSSEQKQKRSDQRHCKTKQKDSLGLGATSVQSPHRRSINTPSSPPIMSGGSYQPHVEETKVKTDTQTLT